MRIIVCIKQVPGTNNVLLDPETGTMLRSSAKGKLNPFDLFAIEQALALRACFGGSVTALAMGPAQAESSLREALYMGADEAYLLCDRALIGSDVLATSHALSQAILRIGMPDLILCGKQTTDGDTAQVGPEIAEMLGIAHVANVTQIEAHSSGALHVTAALEGCDCQYRLEPPFLACMEKDANTPRLPSYRRKKEMEAQSVQLLSLSDLMDADPAHYGMQGSPTRVVRVFAPEHKETRRFLEGSAQTMAEAMLGILKGEKIV